MAQFLETDYEGLDELVSRCTEEGGLVQVDLWQLREALGYKRLGKWVLSEIAEALASKGLGFFPTEILKPEINYEPRQNQILWLYVRDGSPTAQVIDAVIDPQDPELVRKILISVRLDNEGDLTADQKIERIRAIIGPERESRPRKSILRRRISPDVDR